MALPTARPATASIERSPWRPTRPWVLVDLASAGLVAMLIAAAVLRLHDLGARSLWVDELFTVGIAVQDFGTMLMVFQGEEANMAGYYLVMSIWLRIVGGDAGEAVMRLPSVLFGLASIWALYQLGADIDRPYTGLVAALLGGVHAYHVGMSQEARAYSLWALLATMSWIWLLRATDRRERLDWVWYSLSVSAGFYAHLFMALVVAAQVVYVAIRFRADELRALVVSGVGVVVLCLPFVPFLVANHDGGQILHVRDSGLSELLALFRLFGGGTTATLIGYASIGLLGVVCALWTGWRRKDWSWLVRRLAPLLWLLVPVGAVFAASYVQPVFKERYLFAAMPAFPLLAALGVAMLRPAVVSVAVAAALALLSLGPTLANMPVRQEENWRGAVQYLEANARADDGWIFISKRGQLGYEYYAGWLGGRRAADARPDFLESFDWYDLATSEGYYRAISSGTSRLGEFASRHPRIWLVLSHEFDSTYGGDTSEPIRDWLSRRGYGARQRTFQQIRVLLYERPS